MIRVGRSSPSPLRTDIAAAQPTTTRTRATALSADSFEPASDRIGLNDALEYQTPATIAARLADDKATGAGEVRLALYLNPDTGEVLDPANGMRPLPGGIGYYDAIFRQAQQAGEKLSVTLIPDHDALFGAIGNGDVEGFGQRYAQQAASVAAHLSGFGVKDFELGNEPNDAGSWPIDYGNKDAAAAQYMALEAPAYDAIKAAIGGDSKVAMAGLSMCDSEYLGALYRHGLAGHTDAINFHPYDMGSTPEEMRANLDRMHQVMIDHGDGATPVWLTELGTESNPANEGAQAQYLRTALDSLPSYVTKAFWFQMQDFHTDDGDKLWGLEDMGGRHKPSFEAFREEAEKINSQPQPGLGVDPVFAGVYDPYAAQLGAPTGPAFREDNGNLKQVFAGGYALQAPDGSIYVRGLDNSDLGAPPPPSPFADLITQYGDQLGAATSGVFREDNGNLKQTFENGYLLQSPDGTTYARRNDNTDFDAAPPPPPPSPFADLIAQYGDALGAPTSDVFREDNGNLKQTFAHGYLLESPDGSFEARDLLNHTLSPADPFGAQRSTFAGQLGGASSAVFVEDNGNLKQTFANGYLLQSPDGTVYARLDSGEELWRSSAVDEALRDAYRAHQTALGAPNGDAFHEDNGNLKQNFAGGYILMAPDGTIDVRGLDNRGL